MSGSILIGAIGLVVCQTDTLTLARAIELARQRHQSPQIAQAQVERAEAIRALAISSLLPELSLTGRYTRQPERAFEIEGGFTEVIQEENVLTGRASANVTLLEAKNFVVLQRAQPAFEAVELRAKEMERQLGYQVAQVFLAALSSEQLGAAARNRIAVALKAKDDAGKRFKHGLAGDNDVTRADLELATAELAASDAEASTRALRLQLERYVGPDARAPLAIPTELFSMAETSTTALTEEAHRNRPDLGALRAEAEAARIAANEPLWGLMPKLSLDAFYELTSQQGFIGENDNWGVTLSLEWMIYDRGRRYREAEEKAAAAREASLVLERAEQDAANEIARALVQLDRTKVALTRAETRAALSAKNAQEVAVRYREGVANAFELADANAQEFAANAELARARFDLGLSVLALRQLTGQPAL